MPKKSYDPKLAEHVTRVIDLYRREHEHWRRYMTGDMPDPIPEPDMATILRNYASAQNLPAKIIYDAAKYLQANDWEIDATTFLPDRQTEESYEGAYGANIFDEYTEALRREDYELAHQIYDSMSESQRAVIKDRRRMGMRNLNKRGQLDPITGLAQQVLDAKQALQLSPDVEPAFMALAHAMDEYNRGDEAQHAEIGKHLHEALGHIVNHYRQLEDYVANELSVQAKLAVRMYAMGQKMYKKGHYTSAHKFAQFFDGLLNQLPQEEGQVVLLIVSPDDLENLPQAMQQHEEEMTGKMDNMKQRLMLEPACCAKMLNLADRLDKKGLFESADSIDRLLKKSMISDEELEELLTLHAPEKKQRQRRDVILATCRGCGGDTLVDKENPDPYCKQCQRDARTSLKTAQGLPGPYEPYSTLPLGGAAKEKFEEQQARKTRLTDPTGVGGKPVPMGDVVLTYGDEQYLMPRLRAVELNRQDKLTLSREGDTIVGNILDPSVLSDPSLKKNNPEVIAGNKKSMHSSKTAKDSKKKDKKDDHDGKPAKVVEIADAIRRDNPDVSDAKSYAMAWETFCSYTNPSYKGCTEKGKSKRKSPKPYEIKE